MLLTNLSSFFSLKDFLFLLFLRVCLDFEKLEGKKKNLEGSFLFIVWFEKSQKEKKLRGKL